MSTLGQAIAPSKLYERKISVEAMIRKFVGGDTTHAWVAGIYISRWLRQDALWVHEDGAWIAQPLRCFQEELDLSLDTIQRTHTQLKACGAFEVTAQKLYPSAMRKTTHVRPSKVFLLFLLRIGRFSDPELRTRLEVEVGVRCTTLMDATLPDVRYGTLPAEPPLMESTEGLAIKTCGSQTPTLSATGLGEGSETVIQEEVIVPFEKKKTPSTASLGGFKGGQGTSTLEKLKKPPRSVQEAVQATLNKSPTPGGSGTKQKLWAKTALLVHKAGLPFPIKSTPTNMARLWKLKLDLEEEYGGDLLLGFGPLEIMVAATVSSWVGFREWMILNSSQAKKVPESFDLMWLQFHRQKAMEYATGPGMAYAQLLLTGAAPVQSIAPEKGTSLSSGGWKVQ